MRPSPTSAPRSPRSWPRTDRRRASWAGIPSPALRRRHLVPHASAGDGSRALSLPARLRLLPRGRPGGGRPGRARPPARAHQSSAARAREPASEPGRRTAGRGPRAARRGGGVVPRHDARGGREPAHLGGHLPRERADAPRGALGAPAPGRAAGDCARRRRRGLPRPLDRRGGREPPPPAAGRVRRRRHAAARARPRSRSAGSARRITQALGAERINIEDFELRHDSPERGGVVTLLVAGEVQAQRAAALLEGQGYGVDVSPALEE